MLPACAGSGCLLALRPAACFSSSSRSTTRSSVWLPCRRVRMDGNLGWGAAAVTTWRLGSSGGSRTSGPSSSIRAATRLPSRAPNEFPRIVFRGSSTACAFVASRMVPARAASGSRTARGPGEPYQGCGEYFTFSRRWRRALHLGTRPWLLVLGIKIGG